MAKSKIKIKSYKSRKPTIKNIDSKKTSTVMLIKI